MVPRWVDSAVLLLVLVQALRVVPRWEDSAVLVLVLVPRGSGLQELALQELALQGTAVAAGAGAVAGKRFFCCGTVGRMH